MAKKRPEPLTARMKALEAEVNNLWSALAQAAKSFNALGKTTDREIATLNLIAESIQERLNALEEEPENGTPMHFARESSSIDDIEIGQEDDDE